MTTFLYALTVLIWGTTWIAIKNQLGSVPVEASIVYRFALARLVLFLVLAATRRLQPIPLRCQPFVVLQGFCLFSCNFLCFYTATFFVPSGIVSLVFSTATIFNTANAFSIYRRQPDLRVLGGAMLGVAGIGCLFWEMVTGAKFSPDTA